MTRKWTKERIRQEAAKYKTMQDFRRGSGGAQRAMYDYGEQFVNEVHSMMNKPERKRGPLKVKRYEDSLHYANKEVW